MSWQSSLLSTAIGVMHPSSHQSYLWHGYTYSWLPYRSCGYWCLSLRSHPLPTPEPCVVLQTHYHTSHPKLNFYAIVPKGPAEWWTEPHDRDQKFPSAK